MIKEWSSGRFSELTKKRNTGLDVGLAWCEECDSSFYFKGYLLLRFFLVWSVLLLRWKKDCFKMPLRKDSRIRCGFWLFGPGLGLWMLLQSWTCGQDEVPPKRAAWSLEADFELFGMVQLQLEIYMNLCSLFFNTFSKTNFGKFSKF